MPRATAGLRRSSVVTDLASSSRVSSWKVWVSSSGRPELQMFAEEHWQLAQWTYDDATRRSCPPPLSLAQRTLRQARTAPTGPTPKRPGTAPSARRPVRNLHAKTGSPASAPKPSRSGPGRPPGSKNRRLATRHDVGKVLATGEAYARPAHHKVGTKPRRAA
ncbi:hypothetical protein ACFVJM_34565 [Streptomyces virginiae]|uniref:hypothetical protein n=1 Tax=Streptomyces virginiae TaxID=1961 RepID=UPI0036278764